MKDPVLGLQVYVGNLNQTGQPRSVFTLDMSKLGKPIGLATLREGQTKTFANGVQVTFDKWTPYVDLQVSHDPTQTYLLIAALAMVLGLAGSLERAPSPALAACEYSGRRAYPGACRRARPQRLRELHRRVRRVGRTAAAGRVRSGFDAR